MNEDKIARTSGATLGKSRDGADSKRRRMELILDAAVRIIAREGLGELTHRAVAQEAGIPEGSMTFYFRQRADLVRAAFKHLAARQLQSLEEVSKKVVSSDLAEIVDPLVTMVEEELGDALSKIAEVELILAVARDPELQAHYASYRESVAAYQADLARRLGSPKPARDGRIVHLFLQGYSLDALSDPDGVDLERAKKDLRYLLTSLEAGPEEDDPDEGPA
ncbi:MAG: TetR family transcriptional regulator [Myxococcota bacterium]|nr:TetR family transcriptional regulator [Myxococcota bacterium]